MCRSTERFEGGRGRRVRARVSVGGAALLLLTVGLCGCNIVQDASHKAVVKVNGRVITVRQYRDVLKMLMPANSTESGEELAEIKKDLINRLIEEELILQEAERLGVTVSEAEVSSEVEGLKTEYGDESFRGAIEERYGTMENWKGLIRRKLIIRKTVDSVTALAKGPTQAEAKKYYQEHIGEFETPERVRARMIVVADGEEASRIRASLTPANFAATAEEHSLSPEKASGGDLGFFGHGEMPKEFEDVVFKLKPGEISAVIKTGYGYHLFLLEERKKAGKLKFPEAKDRIMEKLRFEKADAEFVRWMVSMKKKADIRVREELL